jgi:hypothetical protein
MTNGTTPETTALLSVSGFDAGLAVAGVFDGAAAAGVGVAAGGAGSNFGTITSAIAGGSGLGSVFFTVTGFLIGVGNFFTTGAGFRGSFLTGGGSVAAGCAAGADFDSSDTSMTTGCFVGSVLAALNKYHAKPICKAKTAVNNKPATSRDCLRCFNGLTIEKVKSRAFDGGMKTMAVLIGVVAYEYR